MNKKTKRAGLRHKKILKYCFKIEKFISSLSVNLYGSYEKIDDRISQALHYTAEFTGAERAYILLFVEEGLILKPAYAGCAKGMQPDKEKPDDILTFLYPWWIGTLKAKTFLSFEKTSKLPDEARQEKIFFEENNIRSSIQILLKYNEQSLGILCVDNINKKDCFSNKFISYFKKTGILFTDILVKKQIQENIIKRTQEQNLLLDNTEIQIWYLKNLTVYGAVNQSHASFFGKTKEEMEHKNLYDIFPPEMANELSTCNWEVFQNKKQIKRELWIKNEKGEKKFFHIIQTPKINEEGFIEYIICTAEDITERKKAEDKIKYLSFHDKVTSLYNRTFFEEELKRLDTERQLPLSIIIGDVNGLKLVNDVFGHFQGDKLLMEVSDILRKCCRKEDIIARWGGDEFAIILPQTEEKNIEIILNRIRHACEKVNRDPVQISIALGSATKTHIEQNIKDIMNKAEENMYRHKLLESKSTRSHILSSLRKSLFERSHETEEHAQRLKEMGFKMGNEMGLSSIEIDELGLLAILHDIGKIAVNDSVLTKPGKLTKEEWEEIKKHPEIGYRIAASTSELAHIADYILSHHERWDGNGYPQGLKEFEIPRLSRILSIIDAFDVMTNERIYKKPINKEEAVEEIQKCSGTQFDPYIVDIFIKMINK